MDAKREMDAKKAMDKVLQKGRVHLYKPIQIAEILYHKRMGTSIDISDVETYRNASKTWRDIVSTRLVGRVCTSSQKFQDNIFDKNAMPPYHLEVLNEINETTGGGVEVYIYKSIENRLASVHIAQNYVEDSKKAGYFSVKDFEQLFVKEPGLRRSVDKMYEIAVHSLFSAIVSELKAEVTVSLGNEDKELISDFEGFIRMVLGIDSETTRRSYSAQLFRNGVANAADRGLDIWANFGPAVQVKHLSLTADLAEDIVSEIEADRIIIVCLDAEKDLIDRILSQIGLGERIQGIITLNDLSDWYETCFSPKYKERVGRRLIESLAREFNEEFPSNKEIVSFVQERGYDKIALPSGWEVETNGEASKGEGQDGQCDN